jgi:hypothetical protein
MAPSRERWSDAKCLHLHRTISRPRVFRYLPSSPKLPKLSTRPHPHALSRSIAACTGGARQSGRPHVKPVQQQPRQRHLIARACTSNLQRHGRHHQRLLPTLPSPRHTHSASSQAVHLRARTRTPTRVHSHHVSRRCGACKCTLWAVHAFMHSGLRSQWLGLVSTCRDRDGAAPCVRATQCRAAADPYSTHSSDRERAAPRVLAVRVPTKAP